MVDPFEISLIDSNIPGDTDPALEASLVTSHGEAAGGMSLNDIEARPTPSVEAIHDLGDLHFDLQNCLDGEAPEEHFSNHKGSSVPEAALASFESLESLPEAGSLAAEIFDFSLDCFDVESEENFLEGLL